MKYLFIWAINNFYQKPRYYFNKDSSYCRFYPTCSEYSKQAYSKYGVIIGTMKTIKRIKSCNSNSKGGIDFP
jgi:putative membrane protein insertion efficiency factor